VFCYFPAFGCEEGIDAFDVSPLDLCLFDEAELNVERYELGKSGKILFNHPEGTHDDRFWALALAIYAAEMAPSPASRPMARII